MTQRHDSSEPAACAEDQRTKQMSTTAPCAAAGTSHPFHTSNKEHDIKITVYSTPKCVQCKLTKGWLDERGIAYDPVDLSQSPDDLAAVQALGYASAPVVIVNHGDNTDETHWYGFRPDMLNEFANINEQAA